MRDEIVVLARAETLTRYPGLSRFGTRWQHQARTLGVAVDCIGLVGAIGMLMGFASARQWWNDDTFRCYPREPIPEQLLGGCNRLLVPVPLAKVQDADIYVLANRNYSPKPTHFGFAATHKGERTIVHAAISNRRVVENRLAEPWVPLYAFRFPELPE